MEKLIHLDENVVHLHVLAEDSEDIIATLSEGLKRHQYVKESFLLSILEREKVFPTGLPLATMGVAIPHTDPEHVIRPMISVAVLENPVEFIVMGSENTKVSVEIVLMLAISDPAKQLSLLEKLMSVFQNDAAMSQLKNAVSAKELVEILDKELNQISVE
ncbi:PTS sugar transporter subunit IIA [Niallia circulans]|uniref:PTS sugar transporter subunit IIA n=1 Tax=Niallia circulans TaxID=1397 RepID=A0A553SM98_NIACI|nr:PTS sugar transporter subunit IIA [Niallia circulans]TRZ38106.1 PTS sugar transporter subunit IIA [Niallia circulans]